MENKLIITVSGSTNTGKSRLCFLLGKFLHENGFDIKYDISTDFIDENHFKDLMSKNFDTVIDIIKERTEIVINEKSLKRLCV